MKRLILTVLMFGFLLSVECACGSAVSMEPVEREHFIFYLDSPAQLGPAELALSTARERLLKLVPDTLPYKPAIYVVGNLEQFNKLIRGKFPDWGAAAAFPERRLIAVKSPDHFNVNRSLEELLAHEYTHLVVSSEAGYYEPPRWLAEGMAMYISTEWSWSDNLAMSKAAVFGQLISLREIENVNRMNESQAHVAYAQSYLTLKYMIDNYGQSSVIRLLNVVAVGGSYDDALTEATGSDYEEFEGEIRQYLMQRFNIVTLFMDTMFFWLGLALIVVIAAFVRYKKRRQYYEKWKQEERLQSTDFDYGDPDNPEDVEDEDEPWRS